MSRSDRLKREEYLEGERPIETAMVEGTLYVREHDGTWRYADTWIKVPGARDMTLSERFEPKFVIAGDGSGGKDVIERVIVSGKDIEEHPEALDWCLEAGVPVPAPDGGVAEVMVPYRIWRERDRIPGVIVAPEHSTNEAERQVAIAEREYREADHALEAAADMRAAVLRQHAGDMTREKARVITGLSVGRIQQLIHSDVELDDLDQMILVSVEAGETKGIKDLQKILERRFGVALSAEALSRRLTQLAEHGYIEKTRVDARRIGYRLTIEGDQALVAALEAENEDN